MACSDSSDDSISPLDSRFICIMDDSSNSEDSDNSSPDRIDTKYTDDISDLAKKHPKIFERVQTLYIEGTDKAYFSTSLMKALGIRYRGSTRVLCDVCIVSRKRPVTLLSFVKESNDEDEVIKYNTKVARHLVTAVRERLYGNFSLVSGVIGPNLCQSGELFRKEIQSMDEDAKLCSVPGWLHMNTDRCERLVEFIDKMFVSCHTGIDASSSAFGDESMNERNENRLNEPLIIGKGSARLSQDSFDDDQTFVGLMANCEPDSTIKTNQLYVPQQSVFAGVAHQDKTKSSISIESDTDLKSLQLQMSKDSVFEEETASSKPIGDRRFDYTITRSSENTLREYTTPIEDRMKIFEAGLMTRFEDRMSRFETGLIARLEDCMSRFEADLRVLQNPSRKVKLSSSLQSSKPDSPEVNFRCNEKLDGVSATKLKVLHPLNTKGDAFKVHSLQKYRQRRKSINKNTNEQLPIESDENGNLTDQEKQRRQSDPQLPKPCIPANRFLSLG